MEMVAASKMRKAQKRMESSRPYSQKMRNVISHLAHAHPEYKHPYLSDGRNVKRVGFIVVTSDRGLCGGLNTNLLKKTITAMKEWREKNVEMSLCCIGQKGSSFLTRFGANDSIWRSTGHSRFDWFCEGYA